MANLRPSLTDASGGLTYHWRAMRYRSTLWRPFCEEVRRWLLAWQPPQQKLVIVGPSAGYSLAPEFLSRFAQITILEPDPLARQLLARRFPAVPFLHGTLDCMGSLAGPACLAEEFPDSAVLFSNVIGQRLIELPSAWPETLRAALARHSWASYHDIISTEVPPSHLAPASFASHASLEEVLAAFWEGGELALHDHETFGVLDAQEYALWQILPSRFHLIGWCCQQI